MSETIHELGERFIKRFEDFHPRVIRREEGAFLCSLKLHEVFRVFRSPVPILLSTYQLIERALKSDPEWLDVHINQMLPSERERSDLIMFAVGPPGNQQEAKDRLSSQVLGVGQPVVPLSAFFATRKSPIESLREAILQYVEPRHFSPYRIDTIAMQKMFIGRKHWLSALRAAHGSQVIVGPRRIGKSSLGRHLEHLLGNLERVSENHEPMSRCSYVDISELGNDASARIWSSILRHFNLQRRDFAARGRIVKLIGATRKDDRSALIDEGQALGNLIKAFPGQLTIILDEVDKWIESEAAEGWPTLDRLRAMADEGRAQVFLIGYESLGLAAENDRFPFVGRGSKLRLDPLTLHEVERLLTEPMAEMGLRFVQKEQILNHLWFTTSGMPHIVQDICGHIVNQVFATKGERTVTMSMLQTAINSAPTVNTFRNPFVQCHLPLAELIAGVVSILRAKAVTASQKKQTTETRDSVTLDEISSVLEKDGYVFAARDFERALAYLELRFVLEATDSARSLWKWTNDIARQTMQERIEKTGQERWMQSLLNQHHEGSWRSRYQLLEGSVKQ